MIEVRETGYDHLFDAQQDFRKIMNALSRPGRITNLDNRIDTPEILNKASALIGLSLMNNDVCFYTDRKDSDIEAFFRLNVSSLPAPVAKADFVFLQGRCFDEALTGVKVGEPTYPEQSAFIIIDVEVLDDEPLGNSLLIELKGPGVKTTSKVFTRGVEAKYLETIKELNVEYPLGVDVFLSDREGNVIGIPRTNDFSWTKVN